jgi:hypothetical protein
MVNSRGETSELYVIRYMLIVIGYGRGGAKGAKRFRLLNLISV